MPDAFEPRVWFLVVAVLIFIAIGVLGILSDAPEALSVTACVSHVRSASTCCRRAT